ncbi:MAG: MTAP family purine nucleoside phosphorylase [Candidatus Glassbacteria bacterium]|nr:MTAP family purine nucleoside phosphorylase [Candidatus Glassbacteria bacterium]
MKPPADILRVPENYLGLAVIGGSGAYDLSPAEFGRRLPGDDPLVVDTPFGESSPVHFFQPGRSSFSLAFMSRHGESGYLVSAPEVNYRANIWALKAVGTTSIVSWSGPGAIDAEFKPGSFVLPDDLIDLTRGRENTFFQGTGLGFIRQNPLFCPRLRKLLCLSLDRLGLDYCEGGVYAATQGPRLETAAEVRMIERLGGRLVGMTLAPEVFLARELELCYHPCCYVANWAEGVRDLPARPGELFDGMLGDGERVRVDNAVQQFPAIILELAARLEAEQAAVSACPCTRTMERYRSSGRIGPDWRTWINPPGR